MWVARRGRAFNVAGVLVLCPHHNRQALSLIEMKLLLLLGELSESQPWILYALHKVCLLLWWHRECRDGNRVSVVARGALEKGYCDLLLLWRPYSRHLLASEAIQARVFPLPGAFSGPSRSYALLTGVYLYLRTDTMGCLTPACSLPFHTPGVTKSPCQQCSCAANTASRNTSWSLPCPLEHVRQTQREVMLSAQTWLGMSLIFLAAVCMSCIQAPGFYPLSQTTCSQVNCFLN